MAHFELKTRIKQIHKSKLTGECVLYVMSRDQRVADNHALLCAQKHAIAKNLPLAVVFCLQENTGVRAREHYEFMITGLRQIESSLKVLNIPFMMLIGPAGERLQGAIHHLKPEVIYFDFSPLKGPKNLLKLLCRVEPCNMYVVDTHNVIPIWLTSEKQEVGAYTIRPKIHKKIAQYLVEPKPIIRHPIDWPGIIKTIDDLDDMINGVLEGISPSGIVLDFESGEESAKDALEYFVVNKLSNYAHYRNDPSLDGQSDLSPYLHFGQISALKITLRLREEAIKLGEDIHILSSPKMPKPEDYKSKILYGINSLLEELLVRRELADNFCNYNDNYNNINSAPGWARISLEKHINDPREYVYTLGQLENAQTHDPAWNSAQRQMTRTGKMHGYMRMYWAKKVLEWSPLDAELKAEGQTSKVAETEAFSSPSTLNLQLSTLSGPEWAIEVLKYLNDHYSIDGGDPNGYAGILWSVAGLHDRPWMERDIFGVIRYMNYAGLKRKFDIESYEKLW